jgi:hypothetical protein
MTTRIGGKHVPILASLGEGPVQRSAGSVKQVTLQRSELPLLLEIRRREEINGIVYTNTTLLAMA